MSDDLVVNLSEFIPIKPKEIVDYAYFHGFNLNLWSDGSVTWENNETTKSKEIKSWFPTFEHGQNTYSE